MKVVPLQEEDLVVQQDRIIIIGALPEEFGTDRALRWATLRYLFLCRKLTELLALTCLGVATDGAIYLVGRRVAILLDVREELFSPMSGYPRMLMALTRLLNRWMRCRETIVAAPVLPDDGAAAAKQGMRARRHLTRISSLSSDAGSVVQSFETWAKKSARANPVKFTVGTVSGASFDVVVPPRVRLFLPLFSDSKSDHAKVGDVITSVVSAQRIRTMRGRVAVVETKASGPLSPGDRIVYTGIASRPWRNLPWAPVVGEQR